MASETFQRNAGHPIRFIPLKGVVKLKVMEAFISSTRETLIEMTTATLQQMNLPVHFQSGYEPLSSQTALRDMVLIPMLGNDTESFKTCVTVLRMIRIMRIMYLLDPTTLCAKYSAEGK